MLPMQWNYHTKAGLHSMEVPEVPVDVIAGWKYAATETGKQLRFFDSCILYVHKISLDWEKPRHKKHGSNPKWTNSTTSKLRFLYRENVHWTGPKAKTLSGSNDVFLAKNCPFLTASDCFS